MINPAIIQLIILLAPYGVRIIEALVSALEDLLAQKHDVPTLAAVSAAIITGIDLAHPGWNENERARCARDAIAVYAAKLAKPMPGATP